MIPEIGKTYHFFDDGKIRESRHYIALVKTIITPEKAKNIYVERPDYYNGDGYYITMSLYDVWREEIDNHRQSKNFTVINGSSTEPGAPWLYAEDTDYFIKCRIPEYDSTDVWFVRMTTGGWFSLDIANNWTSGLLDVSGELYKKII